ncbi:UPF0496 protein [Raphanus sativus]|uniref:UPF0496 protein At5g66660-like n=1 Tax=Raphanus sativus TaxID=3726 RepID=A0A6J0L5X6_RAPSA|nr:UPF0496 protein At5g66660-like [Raphanus sativus]KAJ4874609.1 UPF0496 protein [Raphanus sativus]
MGAAALVCRLMSKYLSSDKNVTNEEKLSFYTSACEEDPELKSFDSSLDQRLSKLKSSLSTGGKTGNNSLNAVKSVCGFLVEVNQNLAENIIANKDLLKKEDLKSLVGLYCESSTSTLDLFTTVSNCTNKAKLSIEIIRVAIQQFEKESMDTNFGGGNVKKAKYAKTLEELNKVKARGDPFGDEFKDKLKSVRAEHLVLLEKLGELVKKLEKKHHRLKRKRKLTTIAFGSVAASILAIEVCALVVAPQLAVNGAVQGAAGLGQLMVAGGIYANDKMTTREKDLDTQKEVVNIMFDSTNVNIQGTNTINSLVEKLIVSLSLILGSVEQVKREEEAVKPVMEAIVTEVDAFASSIKDVGKAVATCSSCVASGKLQVLESITNYFLNAG